MRCQPIYYLALEASGLFVLLETIPAGNWPVFARFERHFALLLAVCARGFVHLSWTSIVWHRLYTSFVF